MPSSDQVKPCGPKSALDRAISILSRASKGRQEDVKADTLGLADRFAIRLDLENSAPRIGDIKSQLIELAVNARKLGETIRSLHYFTQRELRTRGSGVHRFTELADHVCFLEGDFEGLISNSSDEVRSSWLSRLDALDEGVAYTLRNFEERKGEDLGGNTDLQKSSFGSAKWNLVSEGRQVFERFRPGAAVGTEGGDFHLYLMNLFEFVTGLDPEESSKLVPLVKSVCKTHRRFIEVHKEIELLEDRYELLEQSPSAIGANHKADLAAIAAEIRELEREKHSLFGSFYPQKI